MASDKKPRATPNTNRFGLSARDTEIMISAWRCLEGPAKVDKEQLAKLTRLGTAESAGRQFRRIMAAIREASVDHPTTAPGTPGGASNSKGGDDAATTGGAADPDSPSLIASDKKKQKKAAGGGKVAGRKRTMKEADDNGSGHDGVKSEGEAGERPSKIPKHVLGKSIVTLKKKQAAQGGADESDAGEV